MVESVSPSPSPAVLARRPAPDVRGRLRAFLRAPFSVRTWRELGYLLLSVPLALLGAGYVIAGLALSAGTAVTFLGVPLLAAVVLGARGWGAVYRRLAAVILRSAVPDPAPFRSRRTRSGWLRDALSDRTGWRACAFLLLKLPLTVLGAYGPVLLWCEAWFLVISPVIWRLDYVTVVRHGVRRHALFAFGDVVIDTWPRVLLVAGVGVVAVFVAPWPIRWFAQLERWLIGELLGPAARDHRVSQLERSRASAVEDAAATLRRVERDLHDGTQARLVTVAMNLSRARDRLARNDPAGADALLAGMHATATDALAELREVIRGIHPPALDKGLDAALETLAARAPVPVELDLRMSGQSGARPPAAIETMAYFCVAELLANVSRHSGAASARVQAVQNGERLTIRVHDDGCGGARIGVGSGLAGLQDRVGTVDGTLSVVSPAGGPTEVTIELPTGGPR